MNIIYTNLEGIVSIVTPTQEALELLTIDQIAQRVVHQGVPYWIVDPSIIPSDRTFRDAWELAESQLGEPNGYGGVE